MENFRNFVLFFTIFNFASCQDYQHQHPTQHPYPTHQPQQHAQHFEQQVDEYGEPIRDHNIYQPQVQQPHIINFPESSSRPQDSHGYEYHTTAPQVGSSDQYHVPIVDTSESVLSPIRRVDDTKVDCRKNHMVVTFKFSAPFSGYVYPHEKFPQCMLFSGSFSNEAVITLHHGECGQKYIANENDPEFSASIEHRLMIQWEREFMCEDDASVIVRCDRPDDFNKTIAWNFGTLDFAATLTREKHPGPKMWMEIQEGEGPNAKPLGDKTVFIGDTLTLVFTLSDEVFWFDSNILSCTAISGNSATEQITWVNDNKGLSTFASGYTGQMTTIERGCSVKPKIFSHFFKEKLTKDGYLVTLHYAHFKAFRFPTSMKIVIQCDVEVCYRECQEPPSCSSAFQPRAAKIAARKRRSVDDSDVKKLEIIELHKTIEVVSGEDASVKPVPSHSEAYFDEEIQIQKLKELNCYTSTQFYGSILALGFLVIIMFIVAILFYNKSSNQK